MLSPAATTRRPVLHLPRIRPLVAVERSIAALGSATLPRVIERLADRTGERLVLFLPMLILPTVGAASDLLLLGILFLVVASLEAVLCPARDRAAARIGLALGALAWLAASLALGRGLGTGAALALALFVLVRSIESRVPETLWPIGLALAALATALLLDLALVGLGLERSSIWLALAAAIGAALAAARRLDGLRAEPRASTLDAVAAIARRRALLETVSIGASILVLALYAALLSHEPALRQFDHRGQFLALPLAAAALARLVWLALGPARLPAADPLAILLMASWALAGLVLGGAPAA
jgi:hypothetical protein